MRTGRPPYTEELIKQHAAEIMNLKAQGLKQKEVSESLGISNLTIRQRLKRYQEIMNENG